MNHIVCNKETINFNRTNIDKYTNPKFCALDFMNRKGFWDFKVKFQSTIKDFQMSSKIFEIMITIYVDFYNWSLNFPIRNHWIALLLIVNTLYYPKTFSLIYHSPLDFGTMIITILDNIQNAKLKKNIDWNI